MQGLAAPSVLYGLSPLGGQRLTMRLGRARDARDDPTPRRRLARSRRCRPRKPGLNGLRKLGQELFDHGPVGQALFDGVGESRLPMSAGGFGVALGDVDASELD